MRTAYKVWSGVAAVTFVLVAVVDLSTSSPTPTAAPSSPATASAAAAPAAPVSPPVGSATSSLGTTGPAGESVTVTRVIDGDTFEVGKRKIRVLGLDSCEAGTPGGREAKELATPVLENSEVTLLREPRVEKDKYGRELRYVRFSSDLDFAGYMVPGSHSGVYAGRNDARPGYITELRDKDYDGRDCSQRWGTSTSTDSDTDTDTDTDVYVGGDGNDRDGSSSGGFCSSRRWC